MSNTLENLESLREALCVSADLYCNRCFRGRPTVSAQCPQTSSGLTVV